MGITRGKDGGNAGPFSGEPLNVRIVILYLVHAAVHAGDSGSGTAAAAPATHRTANAGIMVEKFNMFLRCFCLPVLTCLDRLEVPP